MIVRGMDWGQNKPETWIVVDTESWKTQTMHAVQVMQRFHEKLDALGIQRHEDSILCKNAAESEAVAKAFKEAVKESRK